MKPITLLVGLVFAYVALVAAFETWLGYAQPQSGDTLVITTTDADGNPHERVLSALETDGRLYVSANHWPRAWFARLLERPNVEVQYGGERGAYVAVPVTGAEAKRVAAAHPHSLGFRILTGFPPRRFARLDPAEAGGPAG